MDVSKQKESPSVALSTIGLNYRKTDSKIKNYEITDDIKKAINLDKGMLLQITSLFI